MEYGACHHQPVFSDLRPFISKLLLPPLSPMNLFYDISDYSIQSSRHQLTTRPSPVWTHFVVVVRHSLSVVVAGRLDWAQAALCIRQ